MLVKCDACQRVFPVPESSIGKRAKCKGCGHVFVIAERSSAGATASPMAASVRRERSEAYDVKDEAYGDDLVDLSAAAAMEAASRPAPSAMTAAPRRAVGPKRVGAQRQPAASVPPIGGEWRVFSAIVLLAGVFVLIARSTPSAALVAFFAFAAMGLLYFIGGVVSHVRSGLRTPGAMRVPWGDFLLILGQVLLATVVPLPIIVYRRRAIVPGPGQGRFLVLFLKSMALGSLGIGVMLLTRASGRDPFHSNHVQQPFVPAWAEHHKRLRQVESVSQ